MRSILFWCLVTTAVFTTGCVVSPPTGDVVLYVPDPEAREIAHTAAHDWRMCGARQIWVRAAPDKDAILLELVDDDDPEIPPGALGKAFHDALYWGSTERIKILRSAVSYAIVAHEMGHALFHRSDGEHFGRGIMSLPVEPDDRITEEDCEALREEFGA